MRFIRFRHPDKTVHTGVREGTKARDLGGATSYCAGPHPVGKWFDGSAPIGPELLTKDETAEPLRLDLRLWLNGELMQDSNARNMTFHISETIAALTAVMTLDPGDVIAMGTPEGVGFARGRALRTGYHLRAEIEGLGQLDTYIGEHA